MTRLSRRLANRRLRRPAVGDDDGSVAITDRDTANRRGGVTALHATPPDGKFASLEDLRPPGRNGNRLAAAVIIDAEAYVVHSQPAWQRG